MPSIYFLRQVISLGAGSVVKQSVGEDRGSPSSSNAKLCRWVPKGAVACRKKYIEGSPTFTLPVATRGRWPSIPSIAGRPLVLSLLLFLSFSLTLYRMTPHVLLRQAVVFLRPCSKPLYGSVRCDALCRYSRQRAVLLVCRGQPYFHAPYRK